MQFGPALDGETPIDDISGLKIKSIKTRSALNEAEGRGKQDAARLHRRHSHNRAASCFLSPIAIIELRPVF
jgi:hypothetical protein